MLSRQRAIDFLREGLQIQEVERKLENDRLLLLREILRNHVAFVPYQNVFLLAQDHETRHVPPFEEMIDDCISLKGGTCSVHNMFFYFLLRALGYDAVIQGSVVNRFPDVQNHHLINLVSGVENEDDLYLVDPAAVYPSYEIIPLHNFTKSSPVYENVFMEYKFEKDGDLVTRYTRRAKLAIFNPNEAEDDWKAFYNFSLKVQELNDILAGIQRTYDDKTSAILGAVSFSLYPFGQAVMFTRGVLKIYDETTLKKETKDLKDANADELYDALRPFWTGIDKNMIKTAMDHLPKPK